MRARWRGVAVPISSRWGMCKRDALSDPGLGEAVPPGGAVAGQPGGDRCTLRGGLWAVGARGTSHRETVPGTWAPVEVRAAVGGLAMS